MICWGLNLYRTASGGVIGSAIFVYDFVSCFKKNRFSPRFDVSSPGGVYAANGSGRGLLTAITRMKTLAWKRFEHVHSLFPVAQRLADFAKPSPEYSALLVQHAPKFL